MGNHTSDCATVMYAHLDPGQLKKPLICDCGASEPPEPEGANDEVRDLSPVAKAALAARMTRHGKVTLEGSAASAVLRLKQAKTEYDAALKAVVEELTR